MKKLNLKIIISMFLIGIALTLWGIFSPGFKIPGGRYILLLNPFASINETPLPQIQEPIYVDGLLKESCWVLEKHHFLLHHEKDSTTLKTPEFLFVRDSLNLYLGFRYNLGALTPLEQLNKNFIELQLNLTACLGDGYNRRVRIFFVPDDTVRNSNKNKIFDWRRRLHIEKSQYFSRIQNGLWSCEISIPFSELMAGNDIFLFYRFGFRNFLMPEREISNYPSQEGKNIKYLKIL